MDYFFIILFGTHSTSIQNCSQNWQNSYFLPSYSSTYSGSETRFVNQIRQPCQQQFFLANCTHISFRQRMRQILNIATYWLFLKMPNRFGGVNLLWPHLYRFYLPSQFAWFLLHNFSCYCLFNFLQEFCRNARRQTWL